MYGRNFLEGKCVSLMCMYILMDDPPLTVFLVASSQFSKNKSNRLHNAKKQSQNPDRANNRIGAK